ncbi:MAG: hypothetical protein AAF442_08645 [Pseudomonadota bacterium]
MSASLVFKKVARLFVEESKNGLEGRPEFAVSVLAKEAETDPERIILTIDDMLHDRLILKSGSGTQTYVSPAWRLFLKYDPMFMGWDPQHDAQRIVDDMHNEADFPLEHNKVLVPRAVASYYDWEPRRLNPTLYYLRDRRGFRVETGLGSAPYAFSSLYCI